MEQGIDSLNLKKLDQEIDSFYPPVALNKLDEDAQDGEARRIEEVNPVTGECTISKWVRRNGQWMCQEATVYPRLVKDEEVLYYYRTPESDARLLELGKSAESDFSDTSYVEKFMKCEQIQTKFHLEWEEWKK